LLDLSPDQMLALVRAQAAALRRPPRTFDDILGGLGKSAPSFAAELRNATERVKWVVLAQISLFIQEGGHRGICDASCMGALWLLLTGGMVCRLQTMAKWIRQSQASSTSKTSQRRVEYLSELTSEIDELLLAHHRSRPDAEDYTLEVLQRLGRERLVGIRGEGRLDRTKQDVGLLVAIRLSHVFGSNNVLTYRENNGKRVSTRAARRAGLEWVSRYTPHRVVRRLQTPRVVLDANITRYLIQGSTNPENILDLTHLGLVRGRHPVSIADAAWAEILAALVRGSIGLDDWRARIGALDAVLCSELPIVPTGRELAHLSGLIPMPGYDPIESSAFYAAAWRFTADAQSLDDLRARRIYEARDGRQFEIQLDLDRPRIELAERGRGWAGWVERIAAAFSGSISLEEAQALVRENLLKDMPESAVDRLAGLTDAVGYYATRIATKEYEPSDNDAVDLDVLFALAMPGIVCTSDRRLRNLLKHAESSDAWRVMSPSELISWLKERREQLCPTCGAELRRRAVRELAMPDDDATEGQFADWIGATESGDFGEWAVEYEELFCPRCESPMMRALRTMTGARR
jgi:hypothetical protein